MITALQQHFKQLADVHVDLGGRFVSLSLDEYMNALKGRRLDTKKPTLFLIRVEGAAETSSSYPLAFVECTFSVLQKAQTKNPEDENEKIANCEAIALQVIARLLSDFEEQECAIYEPKSVEIERESHRGDGLHGVAVTISLECTISLDLDTTQWNDS